MSWSPARQPMRNSASTRLAITTKDELYTGAGEHPQSHPPMTVPSHTATPEFSGMGAARCAQVTVPRQAPGEERPSGVRDAKQVGCLLVTAASDDRKDQ